MFLLSLPEQQRAIKSLPTCKSREMYQNISSFVRTKNVEDLSANSMIKKSYVAERGSKEKTIDMLH